MREALNEPKHTLARLWGLRTLTIVEATRLWVGPTQPQIPMVTVMGVIAGARGRFFGWMDVLPSGTVRCKG